MPVISDKELQLYQFVKTFLQEYGFPPSQRQIMLGLKYKAVKSVQQLIHQLERKGLLDHHPGMSRTLRIVNTADTYQLRQPAA